MVSPGFVRWQQTRLTNRSLSSGPVLRVVLPQWVEAGRLESFCRFCVGEGKESSSMYQCQVLSYDGSTHDYVGVCEGHMALIDRSLFE